MQLTAQDLQRWLEAITVQPTTPQGFMPWVEGNLRSFFAFESLFMAHGQLVAGQIKTTHWLATGHSARFLQQLSTTFELEHRGSMQWWFTHRLPFAIDPEHPPPFASLFELAEIQQFDLKNVVAHGVLNARSNGGTYFSFTGVLPAPSAWHMDALRLLIPVLNDLYLAYIAAETSDSLSILHGLTRRQKDICS